VPPRCCTAASSVPARTSCSAAARLRLLVIVMSLPSWPWLPALALSSRPTRPTSITLICGVPASL
jgi:hypothetical protein